MSQVKKLSKVEQKEEETQKKKNRGVRIIISIAIFIGLLFTLAILEGTTEMNLGYQYLFWFGVDIYIDWSAFFQYMLRPFIYIVLAIIIGYIGIKLFRFDRMS